MDTFRRYERIPAASSPTTEKGAGSRSLPEGLWPLPPIGTNVGGGSGKIGETWRRASKKAVMRGLLVVVA